MRSYKGKFEPKNLQKYHGSMPIIFRSRLEYFVMKWCDENPGIIKWGSESIIVPYICGTDNKVHRYFIDFVIEFSNNEKYLIEIKPKVQTVAPKLNKSGIVTKRYYRESLEYVKNQCKWSAAKEFAEKTGFKFKVWDEETLEKLGIYKR